MIGEEEKQAVLRVLSQSILTDGPETEAFEDKFSRYTEGGIAIALSSCTAALHLSVMALGLKEGDEVIVPALTHPATVNAVEIMGGLPIFCDCGPDGNMTPDGIRALISDRTVGVIVVHFLGNMCRMNEIRHVTKGLWCIEDCALALGSTLNDTHAGLWSDVGCFSFYPAKHITTCEGGMALTKDRELAAKIKALRKFGNEDHVGLNYRMSEVHAAIGREQLRKFPEWLRRRHLNRHVYDDIPELISGSYAVSGLTNLDIRGQMLQMGLETSVYYGKPVPDTDYYKKKYGAIVCPMAREISERSVTMPVGPHLSPHDCLVYALAFKELA